MRRRFINPASLVKPMGYTHVVRIDKPGSMVFVAGQLSADDKGRGACAGDIKAQAEGAFRNLAEALKAAGATLKDVVKLDIYLTDIDDLPVVREVRRRHLDEKRPPAITTVQVSKLARPKCLIEVEAVAVLG